MKQNPKISIATSKLNSLDLSRMGVFRKLCYPQLVLSVSCMTQIMQCCQSAQCGTYLNSQLYNIEYGCQEKVPGQLLNPYPDRWTSC